MDRIVNSLMRYFFSTSNVCGSTAALVVLLLYLFGVIDHGWILLTLGAYIAGALPFAFKAPPAHMPEGLSTTESLEWLRVYVMPKLPTQAKTTLGDIIGCVDGLMPRLKKMEQDGLVEASSRAMLKHTVTRLLPDAVEGYLRLPPAYANIKMLDGGKTAQELLSEQLNLLQKHVHSLEENIVSSDVNSMLANGRFLQDKFNSGISITR